MIFRAALIPSFQFKREREGLVSGIAWEKDGASAGFAIRGRTIEKPLPAYVLDLKQQIVASDQIIFIGLGVEAVDQLADQRSIVGGQQDLAYRASQQRVGSARSSPVTGEGAGRVVEDLHGQVDNSAEQDGAVIFLGQFVHHGKQAALTE